MALALVMVMALAMLVLVLVLVLVLAAVMPLARTMWSWKRRLHRQQCPLMSYCSISPMTAGA